MDGSCAWIAVKYWLQVDFQKGEIYVNQGYLYMAYRFNVPDYKGNDYAVKRQILRKIRKPSWNMDGFFAMEKLREKIYDYQIQQA